MKYSRELLKSYLQWDELAWGEILPLFEKIVREYRIKNGVEIAANKAGISLFFANELGVKMYCTDLDNPEMRCESSKERLIDKQLISFGALDALQMKLEDNSTDLLVFKSFLGGVRTWENQQLAMKEIYRVLKPGGILLFAENLRASIFHRILRKLFIPWSKTWRYLTTQEMEKLLLVFPQSKIETFGFFSAFSKIKFLQSFFYFLDMKLNQWIAPNSKYISFGFAIKS